MTKAFSCRIYTMFKIQWYFIVFYGRKINDEPSQWKRTSSPIQPARCLSRSCCRYRFFYRFFDVSTCVHVHLFVSFSVCSHFVLIPKPRWITPKVLERIANNAQSFGTLLSLLFFAGFEKKARWENAIISLLFLIEFIWLRSLPSFVFIYSPSARVTRTRTHRKYFNNKNWPKFWAGI